MPHRPMGHDGCGGAGMPCSRDCPFWTTSPDTKPVARTFDRLFASTDDTPEREH
jgi:hypothetical protein